MKVVNRGTRLGALLVLGLITAACGTLGTTSSPPSSPGSSSSGSAGAAADIHVEVKGGPLFGTYDQQATSPICTSGLGGEGAFGIQYSVDQPQGISSLQVLIPLAVTAGTGTDNFTATLGLGPLVGGTTFQIDPNTEGSTGTARLDYDGGNSATVTIEGETAQGIGVSIRVECHQVIQA